MAAGETTVSNAGKNDYNVYEVENEDLYRKIIRKSEGGKENEIEKSYVGGK